MKRTPLKRKSKTELAKAKDKLWQLCREIIFRQFGDICYTCGRENLEGSNRHLGHFIPSSVSSALMRYDLNNLRPQCYHCNINLSGNWPAYEAHLIKDGIDPEELKATNRSTAGQRADVLWYQAKITEYEDIYART